MSKTIVVTSRIAEQLSNDLDELAAHRDRSRAWLIEKAIAAFVAQELGLYRSIGEGRAQIERGEGIDHDVLMAELKELYSQRQAA